MARGSRRTLLTLALVGTILYAVFNWIAFEIQMPYTQDVSVRPHYGLLTFVGFAFGPLVGFLTGFVGNVVGDWLTGVGAFTSWPWSVANGLAGLVAGLIGGWAAWRQQSLRRKLLMAAIAGIAATVIGFSFIWIELITQPDLGATVILNEEYLPVVLGNSIASAVVTPILVALWEPLEPHVVG